MNQAGGIWRKLKDLPGHFLSLVSVRDDDGCIHVILWYIYCRGKNWKFLVKRRKKKVVFISTKIIDKKKKRKDAYTLTCVCTRIHTHTHVWILICTVIAGSVTSQFAYTERMKHCFYRNPIFSLIVLLYVLQDISKQHSACYLLRLVSCMLLHAVFLSYLFKNKLIYKTYSCYWIREA